MSNEEKQPEEQAKKGMSKILMIVIALLLVGGGAGGGYFLFAKRAGAQAADGTEEPAPKKKVIASVLKFEPFVVNLADAGGSRYLRIEISIGLDSKEEEDKKEKGGDPVLTSQLRDVILQTLTAKKSEELLTLEGKQKLRDEIAQAAQPLVHKGEITGVFFTEFMVQ